MLAIAVLDGMFNEAVLAFNPIIDPAGPTSPPVTPPPVVTPPVTPTVNTTVTV